MTFFDVRTLMFGHLATTAICTVLIVFLWFQNRSRIAGTFFWVLDFFFQTLAVLLIVLRGFIPDWISLGLASPLVITGTFLGYLGLRSFVGKIGRQNYNYVLWGIFLGLQIYFSFFYPNLWARDLTVSAGILVFCSQCLWFAFSQASADLRRILRGVGLVFGLFSLISVIHIVVTLAAQSPENDIFKTGLSETLPLLASQLLLILLAYTLNLMVNQRLLMEIRAQEEKFTKAFHSAPYPVMLTHLSEGQIVEVNNGFEQITGYRSPEVIGKTTRELHLWNRDEDRSLLIRELSESGRVREKEFLFRSKSGEPLIGMVSSELIHIKEEPFILTSIRDITDQKRAEEALRESEGRYRQVVKNANEAIMVAQDGMIKFHNPKATELSGYSEEELPSRPFVEFIHPEDRELVLERYRRRLAGDLLPQVYPFRIITKQGQIKWVEINSVLMSWDGKPATLIFLSEITERKEIEDQLQKMTIMDDLTGLYNRRGFFTLAQQQLKVAERNKKEMFLFFADLDNMKWINDTLGHLEGDQALMDVAEVLQGTFRESDILSRIGGDEFAVLTIDSSGMNPEFLRKRVRNNLSDINQRGTRSYSLSLSIGLARYLPEFPSSIDQLLAEADRSMYEEKRKKNT